MRFEFYCPGCGVREVEFESFDFAVMLAPNMALLSYECPCCSTPVNVSAKLSRPQQDFLRRALEASQAEPGIDGRPTRLSTDYLEPPTRVSYSALPVVDCDSDILRILISPPTSTPEARSRLQAFHEQLEQLGSVDEALWRIDASRGLSRPGGPDSPSQMSDPESPPEQA